MSGLDGLGWPNPEDEPKPNKTMNSQLEIKLAPTPETDAENQRIMESWNTYASDHCKMLELAQKLERERDVAQKAMGDARDVLLDAMPDANAPTKILAEMIVAERDTYQRQADALLDWLGVTQERMIDAERERDELREWASVNGVSSLAKDRDQFRAQLREEQQLHVQTLNERDEAQEQRYRLAAVLQRIRDGYGGQAAAPDCCEDCEFLIPIDEALQSLNQPTEMTDERWGYGAGTSRAGLRITNQSERLVPVAITPLFIIL